MNFSDLHIHILSGVDDGPKTEADMYAMADAACSCGTHYRSVHHDCELTTHCGDLMLYAPRFMGITLDTTHRAYGVSFLVR